MVVSLKKLQGYAEEVFRTQANALLNDEKVRAGLL
jgi:hypothetical protein